MQLDLEQFREAFQAEATELLGRMEQNLLDLEGGFIPDVMRDVFGAVHTIKGNSALMGYSEASRVAHAAEDLIEKLAEGVLAMKPEHSTLLLHAIDALRKLLGLAPNAGESSNVDVRALEKHLFEAAGSAAVSDELANTGAILVRSDRDTESAKISARDEGPRSASPSGSTDERSPETTTRRGQERVLRVDLHRLDRMLDLLGEITVARGRIAAMIAGTEPSRQALVDAHADVDLLFLDLQELLLKVRMVPIRRAFQPFARSLRDICLTSGKLARLETSGEDVEVDASIVDMIRVPLTHLIRNAVDHGIEHPEIRRTRGKSPIGVISLRARRDAGCLDVRVTDDGGGLDRARIRARAEELGLLGKIDPRDDTTLYSLVFEPGFSTVARVTELSGRGIGMNVVKREIEALRGSVRIESTRGVGTVVSLRVPLSLSILDGFWVTVGDDTYIIPMENVRECIELPAEQGNSGSTGILNLRGRALPYLRLRDHFGTGGKRPRRESVVMIEDMGGQAGIVVDELVGHTQSVIKPLSRLFQRISGISGSAILGNGQVALILDIAALLQQALRASSGSSPSLPIMP